MSGDAQDPNEKVEQTRRNILKTGLKMGTLLGSASLVGSVGLAMQARAGVPACAVGCRCFLKGTYIQTAEGTRKVEELAIGDLLPTMFGGTRPIQWIGRFPIKRSDPSKPWPKDARPVRIARSALAPNVPQADLYVTQAHGVFIDGLLVSAEYLVNDATITLCEASASDELEFFHVKLETHDVIYAEGAPVELS
jgi:Hint domain